MEKLQAYKFRVYFDAQQQSTIYQWCRASDWVYNWGLNLKNEDRKKYLVHIEGGGDKKDFKSLGKFDLSKMLTDLKKEEDTAWLKEVEKSILTYCLDNLDKAFKNFYRNLKSGKAVKSAGVPAFKSKHKGVKSCTIAVDLAKIKKNPNWMRPIKLNKKYYGIKIPKIKKLVKIRMHREIEGTMKAVTFSEAPDGWYISILTKREVPTPKNKSKTIVGIDRGIKIHTVSSEGYEYHLPDSVDELREKRIKAQRKLKRMERGSNNSRKQYKKIAILHMRESRAREYFLHFVANDLLVDAKAVVLEDLNIKNMSKSAKGDAENHGKNVKPKQGLNREILKQAWGKLDTMLQYKANWNGTEIVKINPRNTSRKCHNCGHVAKESRKTQADFECVRCGHRQHADYNAALNIRAAYVNK